MRADVLAGNQIEQDRSAGLMPCFVCATVSAASRRRDKVWPAQNPAAYAGSTSFGCVDAPL